MLAYPRGLAFTAASFDNLRKVRISLRKSDHSHPRKYISGLWLEYSDSALPVIVGQWFEELDSLTLEPDDRLVSMTTWHDCIDAHKRVKFGPVTKIHLSTAKGYTKELLDQPTQNHVCLSYSEGPYERFVSPIYLIQIIHWGLFKH
jgi:hypothetical protein